MDGDEKRGRLGSFVVGGLLGASAALAAARRKRRRVPPPRRTPQGLQAFEGAPLPDAMRIGSTFRSAPTRYTATSPSARPPRMTR